MGPRRSGEIARLIDQSGLLKSLPVDSVQFSGRKQYLSDSRRQQSLEQFMDNQGMNLYQIVDTDEQRKSALELLDRVFTDKTVDSDNNYQYLEFIGDGVLADVVRVYLWGKLPRGEHQRYLKMHNQLASKVVSNNFIAIIAEDMNLLELLKRDEDLVRDSFRTEIMQTETNNRRLKLKVKQKLAERNKKWGADCLEALLGALVLIDPSHNLVRQLMEPYLKDVVGLVTEKERNAANIDADRLEIKFKKLYGDQSGGNGQRVQKMNHRQTR